MKTLFYTALSALALISCSSNETKMEKGNLKGDWVIVKAEGMMAEENLGTHYIFDDNKLTFSKNGFDNPAKSTITDSTFTWNNGSMVMEYDYYFENNQLVAEPKGSDQKLYLEKE